MVAKHNENHHFKQHVFVGLSSWGGVGCLIPDETLDVRYEGMSTVVGSMNFRGTDKRSENTELICNTYLLYGNKQNPLIFRNQQKSWCFFCGTQDLFLLLIIRAFWIPNNWNQIKKTGKAAGVILTNAPISSEKSFKITIHLCIQFRLLPPKKHTHYRSPHVTLWVNIFPPGNYHIPQKWHFEDEFPFPKVGYLNSLEGI